MCPLLPNGSGPFPTIWLGSLIRGVSFNVTKSAELCLGTPVSPQSPTLDNMLLPRVNTKLHVGVVLGDNLKWLEHIERVLKRVAGPVHLCKQLAYNHRLPSPVIRRFYVAYIRPRMEYCSAVWGGCSQTLLARFERVQLQGIAPRLSQFVQV